MINTTRRKREAAAVRANVAKSSRRAINGLRVFSLTLFSVICLNGASAIAQVNVVTAHNDIARTGQNLQETVLTPANVNATNFGKLFSHSVDGLLYAQPLYVANLAIPGKGTHNVVYVETDNDSIYAFDADSNAGTNSSPLWSKSMLPDSTWVSQWGILGTPVIDLPSQTIFLVSSERQGSTYQFRIHALDITTGAEKPNSPVKIQATVPGTGSGSVGGNLTFDPFYHRQRPALLLLNGVVYVGLGSNGDIGPWHGWLFSFDQTSLKQIDVFCTTPSGTGSGIWMSGAGLAAEVNDSSKPYGRMFLTTGNGAYSASKPYTKSMSYGMSVLNMDLTGGVFTVTDEFTQSNEAYISDQDGDLSAGGVVLLPTQTLASGKAVDTIVADGKAGDIFILDRNNLGGFHPDGNQVIQELQTPEYPGSGQNWGSGLYGDEAYWNGNIYIGGTNPAALIPLDAYSFKNGQISTTPTSETAKKFSYPGVTPSVSSNGTSNGIVWALAAKTLLAYDANDLTKLLYSSSTNESRDNPGGTVIYTTPTVANGKVYAGGTDALTVYGLNPPPAVVHTLTVNVADASMVSGSAVLPPFSSTVTGLIDGDQLGDNIVINYNTVASTSSTPGTYTVTATVAGPSAYLYNPVINPGTLTITPSTPPFFPVRFGETPQLSLNNGAVFAGSRLRLTDGGMNEASSAFFKTPVGVQQFTTSFDFLLTSATADGFTFTIQGVDPTALGSGGGHLGYATIPKSVAIKFDLYNNGGEGIDSTGLYINGADPFVPSTNLSSTGIDLHSGHIFDVQITYNGATLTVVIDDTATNAKATQTYTVDIPSIVGGSTAYVGFTAATGAKSATQDILGWSYTPSIAQPSYPRGFSPTRLSLNGGAIVNGVRLQLTSGKTNQTRSAFYKTAVNVQKFATAFDFQIKNGNADGFTFTVQGVGPTALGVGGAGLGYESMANSVAVKFDLHSNGGEGPNSTGMYVNGAIPTVPYNDLSTTAISLHSSDIMNAQITYDGSILTVVITDKLTLATTTQSYTVDIPTAVGGPTAYVGFTGASGGNTAVQEILNWLFDAGSVQ